jgi:hypothetical protein
LAKKSPVVKTAMAEASQGGSSEETDPDEFHDPEMYFVDEEKMDETFNPGWMLKKGDTFEQSSKCRDFVVNGPPIGEVARLQDYSDEVAKDRAFCVAASSVSTIHDLLRRLGCNCHEAAFYRGRVNHYRDSVLDKDREIESLTVQVGNMGQANFSLQVRERKLKHDHSTERQTWEKEKSELETRLSGLEEDKNAALVEAEAKVVVRNCLRARSTFWLSKLDMMRRLNGCQMI